MSEFSSLGAYQSGQVGVYANAIQSGPSPSGPAGGDLTGTYPDPSLRNIVGLTPNTYGNATNVAQVQIDSKGRTINAANVPIAFPAALPPNGTASGDLDGTYPAPILRDIVGLAAGTYGDATNVAQVQIDTKGRVISATNVPIAASAAVTTGSFMLYQDAGPATGTNWTISGPPTALSGLIVMTGSWLKSVSLPAKYTVTLRIGFDVSFSIAGSSMTLVVDLPGLLTSYGVPPLPLVGKTYIPGYYPATKVSGVFVNNLGVLSPAIISIPGGVFQFYTVFVQSGASLGYTGAFEFTYTSD